MNSLRPYAKFGMAALGVAAAAAAHALSADPNASWAAVGIAALTAVLVYLVPNSQAKA